MSRGTPLLSIEINAGQVAAVRRDLGGLAKHTPTVLRTAINKTLRDAQSAVATKLTEVINVKRNNIRRRMKVTSAARSSGGLVGRMTIMSRKIGLINFGAKDLRPKKLRSSRKPGSGAGVTAQIYKGGPIVRLPHAFIAKGNQNNRQVFDRAAVQITRSGVTTFKARAARLPIYSIKGVSLKDVYDAQPQMHALTVKVINEKLERYIRSQIKYVLAKNGQAPPATAAT